jgi:hypothetical protein
MLTGAPWPFLLLLIGIVVTVIALDAYLMPLLIPDPPSSQR